MSEPGHDPSVHASVVDLWRASLADVALWLTPSRRVVASTGAALGLVFMLMVLRLGGAERNLLLAWTWLACVISVVSPMTGLMVLAAVLPFSEWLVFETVVGAKALLIPFVVTGLLVRGTGPTVMSRPVRLGLALAAVTGAGVVLTAAGFEPTVVERALAGWVAGIGGALMLLGVAWWGVGRGWATPAFIAIAAVAIAAALSLAEFLAPGSVRGGVLGILLRPALDDIPRVTGIIPAPNAMATLLTATVAVVIPFVRGRHGPVRMGLLALIGLFVVATVFTYSRSGMISLFVLLVLAVAVRHPRRAVMVAITGAVLSVVALPAFMLLRAEAMGVGSTFDLGAVISGDARRFEGWAAAIGMWRTSPLIGHGFQAFRELAFQYGSTYVTAPHNELLRLLAEGGLVAAGIAVAFVGTASVALWKRRDAWGYGGLGALLALLIGGTFNNPFLYIQVLGPVCILIGVSLGSRHEAGSMLAVPAT